MCLPLQASQSPLSIFFYLIFPIFLCILLWTTEQTHARLTVYTHAWNGLATVHFRHDMVRLWEDNVVEHTDSIRAASRTTTTASEKSLRFLPVRRPTVPEPARQALESCPVMRDRAARRLSSDAAPGRAQERCQCTCRIADPRTPYCMSSMSLYLYMCLAHGRVALHDWECLALRVIVAPRHPSPAAPRRVCDRAKRLSSDT